MMIAVCFPLMFLPVSRGALLTGEGEKRTACAHCGTGRFCRVVRKGPAVNRYINRTQVTLPSPKNWNVRSVSAPLLLVSGTLDMRCLNGFN